MDKRLSSMTCYPMSRFAGRDVASASQLSWFLLGLDGGREHAANDPLFRHSEGTASTERSPQ